MCVTPRARALSLSHVNSRTQADPSHAHAWQAWGLMETRAGNYDVARSLWERGLKAVPMHGPLWQVSRRRAVVAYCRCCWRLCCVVLLPVLLVLVLVLVLASR